jgi:hypothetical protein
VSGLRHPIADFAALVLPVAAVVALRFAASGPAQSVIEVTMKDHHFSPSEIHVQARLPATLIIINDDSLDESFSSSALKIEKVFKGGEQETIHLGPLDRGRYPFEGEDRSATIQGTIIAE